MTGARGMRALALIATVTTACAGRAVAPKTGLPSDRVAPTVVALPSDSQQLAKLAHAAQNDFESLRRRHLTRTMPWGSRQCDEIVGRFCLWHADRSDEWTPPTEVEAVRRGRGQLVARLDTLVSVLADPWVTGQRVRYLVEAGRAADALDAARGCTATPSWWCAALEGYALHTAGRFPAADSAFVTALSAMPDNERCRWTDVSLLLDAARARREYRAIPCTDRTDFDDRFWTLADPLWLVPGNDRRTEHYARLVLDRLQERAASGYGLGWGDDLAELLVRYGWPAGWERQWGRPGTIGMGSIVSHHHRGARTFAPTAAVLDAPQAATHLQWPLEPARPRSAHLTPYADEFDHLEHQLAVFPRGETAVVVAAYELGDGVAPSGAVEAMIAHWPIDRALQTAAPITSLGPRGVVVDTVAVGPAIVSVEALARDARRAARSRYGISVRPLTDTALSLSDILLFRPDDTLPGTVDDAAPMALASSQIEAGGQLGVYWEIAGAVPGEPLDLTVSLEREGKSWVRKAFEWIGLASDRSLRTRLRWDEEPRDQAIIGRALVLDLPDLESGRYRLTVEVTDAAGRSATTARALNAR